MRYLEAESQQKEFNEFLAKAEAGDEKAQLLGEACIFQVSTSHDKSAVYFSFGTSPDEGKGLKQNVDDRLNWTNARLNKALSLPCSGFALIRILSIPFG